MKVKLKTYETLIKKFPIVDDVILGRQIKMPTEYITESMFCNLGKIHKCNKIGEFYEIDGYYYPFEVIDEFIN